MDVPMGRTIEDIVEYLKNKLNESVQLSLDKEVERHWRE
jgi:hypothetical protein